MVPTETEPIPVPVPKSVPESVPETGKKQSPWLNFLDRAEPDLAELEPAYRQHFLMPDALLVRRLLPIYLVAMLAFANVDYQLYGWSITLAFLFTVRLIAIVSMVWLYLNLPRVPSIKDLDRWIFIWSNIIYAISLFVSYTRSLNTFYNASVSVLLVVVTYLLIPNRLAYRIIPAVLFSLGEIAISVFLRYKINPVEVRTNILALILANILGYSLSIRLYGFRRSQFRAQHEEKLARAEMERLARIDGLTGIYNRRHFMELAQHTFLQNKHNISVLYLDIDHFKRINDTYGHAVGDVVLKNFTRVVQTLHPSDALFGRLGGEEFALVLPNTPLEQALEIAEYLRASIEAMRIPNQTSTLPSHIQVTVSMGATLTQSTDLDIEMPLHRADLGLYQAKTTGRNRVAAN
jgi:diguanylate cyclase (GGDEF)-like protein